MLGWVTGFDYVHVLCLVKFDKRRQLVHYLDWIVLSVFEGRQAIPQLLVYWDLLAFGLTSIE